MIFHRAAFIAALAKGKRVLDIGCVNHTLSTRNQSHWLHGLLRQQAAYLVGLDYEREPIEALGQEGYNVFCADATAFDLHEQFDLVIAGEIIEHLTCPGKILECAQRHLAPGGRLVLSCPNANNFLFFLETCLLGREIDNTDHTCLFTPTTMTVLLTKCGYRPLAYHFVAEDLAYYKTTWLRKAVAHAMWSVQVLAGALRPCLCKNFITIAEPIIPSDSAPA